MSLPATKCVTPLFFACTPAPPSSSKPISWWVTVFTTSGPVTNMKELPATMNVKSVIAGL